MYIKILIVFIYIDNSSCSRVNNNVSIFTKYSVNPNF